MTLPTQESPQFTLILILNPLLVQQVVPLVLPRVRSLVNSLMAIILLE